MSGCLDVLVLVRVCVRVCPDMHCHCVCTGRLIELPVQKTVVAEGSPEPCGKMVPEMCHNRT